MTKEEWIARAEAYHHAADSIRFAADGIAREQQQFVWARLTDAANDCWNEAEKLERPANKSGEART